MNKTTANILLITIIILVSLLSSFVLLFGGAKLTIYLMLGILGFVLLFSPPIYMIYILLFIVFFVLGPINYFAKLDTTWGPYLICLELFFMALITKITDQKKSAKNQSNKKIPLYIWCALLMLILSIFSTLTSTINIYTLLIGFRNLFFVWGIYFIFTTAKLNIKNFRNVWAIFIFAGITQLPMAIYQRFIVASARVDAAYWDSVIGTFPGTKIAGDSGGMAFFLLGMTTMAVSLWRHAELNGKRTILYVCLFVSPIMLGEVKVVYILFPVMTMLVFRAELKRNPLLFLVGFFAATMFVGGVYFAGKYFNNTKGISNQTINIDKEFNAIFGFSTDLDAINRQTGELGRFAALHFWWVNNKEDPMRLVIGHGIGTTKSDGLHNHGSVASKYRPYAVGNSTAATLLWELGILGLFLYLLIYFSIALRASQLSKISKIPSFSRAMLFSSSIIIWTMIVIFPYNNPSVTTQVFIFMLFGLVAYWNKQVFLIK